MANTAPDGYAIGMGNIAANAESMIQANEVEKAAERFSEALVGDKKLMVDTTDRYPSWFRDAMMREIAGASLTGVTVMPTVAGTLSRLPSEAL